MTKQKAYEEIVIDHLENINAIERLLSRDTLLIHSPERNEERKITSWKNVTAETLQKILNENKAATTALQNLQNNGLKKDTFEAAKKQVKDTKQSIGQAFGASNAALMKGPKPDWRRRLRRFIAGEKDNKTAYVAKIETVYKHIYAEHMLMEGTSYNKGRIEYGEYSLRPLRDFLLRLPILTEQPKKKRIKKREYTTLRDDWAKYLAVITPRPLILKRLNGETRTTMLNLRDNFLVKEQRKPLRDASMKYLIEMGAKIFLADFYKNTDAVMNRAAAQFDKEQIPLLVRGAEQNRVLTARQKLDNPQLTDPKLREWIHEDSNQFFKGMTDKILPRFGLEPDKVVEKEVGNQRKKKIESERRVVRLGEKIGKERKRKLVTDSGEYTQQEEEEQESEYTHEEEEESSCSMFESENVRNRQPLQLGKQATPLIPNVENQILNRALFVENAVNAMVNMKNRSQSTHFSTPPHLNEGNEGNEGNKGNETKPRRHTVYGNNKEFENLFKELEKEIDEIDKIPLKKATAPTSNVNQPRYQKEMHEEKGLKFLREALVTEEHPMQGEDRKVVKLEAEKPKRRVRHEEKREIKRRKSLSDLTTPLNDGDKSLKRMPSVPNLKTWAKTVTETTTNKKEISKN